MKNSMPAKGGSASGGKKITCHDRNGKFYEVDVDKLSFRPSIYGILIEGSKVLLSKQWDGYDFPGGGINIDETLEQALKREFFEETGLKVEMDKVVHCQSSFYINSSSNKPFNAVVIYFLCHKVGGELSLDHVDDSEKAYIGMPEWIEISQLAKLKFYNPIDSPAVVRETLRIKIKSYESR